MNEWGILCTALVAYKAKEIGYLSLSGEGIHRKCFIYNTCESSIFPKLFLYLIIKE
jgi:hypothetical protein